MNDGHISAAISTFEPEYRELELEIDADWNTVQASYRRLVNLWHPDRFAQQPDERDHAQARFIRLTRAFRRLRQYYRANHRLPLQPIAAPDDLAEDRIARDRDAQIHAESVSPAESEVAGASIFSEDVERGKHRDSGKRTVWFWAIPGVFVVCATLAAFFVFDQKQKRDAFNAGREVLRSTAPSAYMPTSNEVRRQSTRGAFVQGDNNGTLGDQLMPNVFK